MVHKKFSNNGWISVDILIFLLNNIFKITKERSVLFIDQYSVHTDDFVCHIARMFNIKLLYIPVGATYKHQPLDVLVNGSIKSSGKRISKEMYIKDIFTEFSLKNSVQALIEATKCVKEDTIKKSFEIVTNIR